MFSIIDVVETLQIAMKIIVEVFATFGLKVNFRQRKTEVVLRTVVKTHTQVRKISFRRYERMA